MESIVSMYKDHNDALEAIKALKAKGFSSKHISLISKLYDEEIVDNKENATSAVKGVSIGAAIGTIGGILTGVGLLAIPGVGFLVGAGALAGAVAGFDFGVIGGGIITALAIGGLTNEMEKKYHKELEEGKSLLIFQGTEKEIEEARSIMTAHGTHTEMNVH